MTFAGTLTFCTTASHAQSSRMKIEDAAVSLEAEGLGKHCVTVLGPLKVAEPAHQAEPTQQSDPLTLRNGALVLFGDVRLGDRKCLCDELGVSQDLSDAQIALDAFIKWGTKSVTKLVGEFAFAIFDNNSGELFCARDHIGFRPFYFAATDREFCFASRIGPLLAAYPQFDQLDPEFVSATLANSNFNRTDLTFFQSIKKLPPGHHLRVKNGAVTVTRYWCPESIQPLKLPDDDAYVDEGRRIVSAAVKDSLRGDHKFGVHLSGGLDSCLIAALATAELGDNNKPAPLAFAWHFAPDLPDDPPTQWTETARASLGLELIAPEISPAATIDLFKRDWPRTYNVVNLFHEDAVQNCAQERGIDVILSGFGGDEGLSFNGRGLGSQLLRTGRWRELGTLSQRKGILGWLAGFKAGLRELNYPISAKLTDRKLQASYLASCYHEYARRLEGPKLSLVDTKTAMLTTLQSGAVTARLEDWAASGEPKGIAYRYPLLDRRVLEFAFSLPSHLFRRNGTARWIMRQICAGLVPERVRLNQSKIELGRVEKMLAAADEAMSVLGQEIHLRQEELSRSDYLDLDRLIADLKGPTRRTGGNFYHRRAALQFLDIM